MDVKRVPRWVRGWFWGAAIYNVLWGAWVILLPGMIFELCGMDPINYPGVWQGVGMIVLVYALGYYYIGKDPERYGNFVWVGLLGKTFGPLGGVMAFTRGEFPLAFAWVFVFNDLIWWPAFWKFALTYARKPLE